MSGMTKTRVLWFCGECDDWKPGFACPDCGTPCTKYVRRSDNVIVGAGRSALGLPPTTGVGE
jgi:hypothetical protein